MSLRRNTRLRREFLYRKSLEGKEKAVYERKRKLREALEDGKPIPTELRSGEAGLRHQIELEDDVTAVPKTHVDDEYADAGMRDPKVCVTTSRDPSSRLKQFAKEVRLIFPNSQRINRGNTKIEELVAACRANDFTDIVLIQEHRGEPVSMVVSHLPFGPTVHLALSNCVLRHDIADRGTVSEAYPHLIFHNFNSPLGERISTVLKHLFPVPKEDTKRVVTFANQEDFVSFRHHVYAKSGPKEVQLQEVGPRFEMRPYQIKLGTLDQPEAESEWVLRPYMNTAKKRHVL